MRILTIVETPWSPYVLFNGESGELYLVGRSIPENAQMFYTPLIEWTEKYVENPQEETIFYIKLTHFNTSSTKCILSLLMCFAKLDVKNNNIMIKWYYEEYDEDMLELGEDYAEMFDFSFELIEDKN